MVFKMIDTNFPVHKMTFISNYLFAYPKFLGHPGSLGEECSWFHDAYQIQHANVHRVLL